MIIPPEIKNLMQPLGLNYAELVKQSGALQFFALGFHDDRDNVVPTGLPCIARLNTKTREIYKLSVAEAMELTSKLE